MNVHIHCTDVKRETVYIKSAGRYLSTPHGNAQWEKDEENKKLKHSH